MYARLAWNCGVSRAFLLACVPACLAAFFGCSSGGGSSPGTFQEASIPDGSGGSGDTSGPSVGVRSGGDAEAPGDPPENGSNEEDPTVAFEPEEIFSDEADRIEGPETFQLLLRDFDGDGIPELVSSDRAGVRLQEVRATDATDEAILLHRTSASALAGGDLDADGDVDLVLGFEEEPVVAGLSRGAADEIFFNDGTGILWDSRQRLGVARTRALTLEDVDGDGALDLITGAIGSNPIRLNEGDGFFLVAREFLGQYRTVALATGDVDLDGQVDLMTGNEAEVFSGGVLAGEPDRQWSSSVTSGFSGALPIGDVRTVAVVLADFDGDNDLDYLTVSSTRNLLFINDGEGSLLLAGTVLESSATTQALVSGDLDGDGDVDLVQGTDIGARVWLNDGAANFRGSSVLLRPAANALALGDLDRDTDLDLVAGHRGGVSVWTNLTAAAIQPVPLPEDSQEDGN